MKLLLAILNGPVCSEKFYTPFHKTVTNTLEKKERKTGVRLLGNHPETGEPVTVRMGRFGPVAQIGDSGNDGKAQICQPFKKPAAGNNNSRRGIESFPSAHVR